MSENFKIERATPGLVGRGGAGGGRSRPPDETEPAWTAVPFRPERGAAARRAQPLKAKAWKTLAAGALHSTLAMALSAALCLGGWEAVRLAAGAPVFTLREVRFQGLAHASRADLLARSGLSQGANLLRLDLAAATRAMEGNPWVAQARLSRRLPGTVEVELVEHRPAAQIRMGGLYLADDLGRVFKRASPEDGVDLPLVTGLSREEWAQDRPSARLRLYLALQLVDSWRNEGLPPASLEEVRLDEDGGVTAFARESGAVQEIRLGDRELSLKLHRLSQVRAALARRGERAVRIDLDNPSRPDWASAQLAAQER
jgi:cell division protein FtsQ